MQKYTEKTFVKRWEAPQGAMSLLFWNVLIGFHWESTIYKELPNGLVPTFFDERSPLLAVYRLVGERVVYGDRHDSHSSARGVFSPFPLRVGKKVVILQAEISQGSGMTFRKSARWPIVSVRLTSCILRHVIISREQICKQISRVNCFWYLQKHPVQAIAKAMTTLLQDAFSD